MFCLAFLNEPDEICGRLSEKRSKGRVFAPEKLEITLTKEKEMRTRKSEKKKGEEEKAMFYNGYFVFGPKITVWL